MSALDLIQEELISAKTKWPGWPTDPIHAAAILAEESGEVVKAALHYSYEQGNLDELIKEAIQVGAMAIRIIENACKYQRIKSDGVIQQEKLF